MRRENRSLRMGCCLKGRTAFFAVVTSADKCENAESLKILPWICTKHMAELVLSTFCLQMHLHSAFGA